MTASDWLAEISVLVELCTGSGQLVQKSCTAGRLICDNRPASMLSGIIWSAPRAKVGADTMQKLRSDSQA